MMLPENPCCSLQKVARIVHCIEPYVDNYSIIEDNDRGKHKNDALVDITKNINVL